MTVDQCHGGYTIHTAFEGEVPYRTRDSSCEGRLECSLAMLSGRDQS